VAKPKHLEESAQKPIFDQQKITQAQPETQPDPQPEQQQD